MEFRDYPPVELRAAARALELIGGDITHIGLNRTAKYLREVWLQSGDGTPIVVGVNQRDLEFKFEVFGLWLNTPSGLAAHVRHKGWDLPTAKPPEAFEPWPIAKPWRIQVLRRAEFIVEDAIIENAHGENPIAQGAARPGEIPDQASAQCEVAVGLLFTGSDGVRLVLGVDWFPETLVFLRDETQIDQYIACCETIDLASYRADVWETP